MFATLVENGLCWVIHALTLSWGFSRPAMYLAQSGPEPRMESLAITTFDLSRVRGLVRPRVTNETSEFMLYTT